MDRRVRKTREALYSAFVALIAEEGYDQISIQNIIDAADVGRTTFYAHFRTKEDLLGFGFERLRGELGDSIEASHEETWAFLDPLLRHARSHAGLFKALTDGSGGALAEAQFRRIIDDLVATTMGTSGKASIERDMLVGALIAGIRCWISSGGSKGGDVAISGSIRRMATALTNIPIAS